MKTILPTLKDLQKIDLSDLADILNKAKTSAGSEFNDDAKRSVMADFMRGPGREPYAFYAYLSTMFDNGTILDIGTLFGSSALALSYNLNNKVITYDVNVHNDHSYLSERSNITWKHVNFMEDSTIDWKNINMILIDTDHTGVQETEFMQFLIEKNWSGLLLLDDIHLNQQMEEFWDNFDDDIKIDVSDIAHSLPCGTGFVEFNLN